MASFFLNQYFFVAFQIPRDLPSIIGRHKKARQTAAVLLAAASLTASAPLSALQAQQAQLRPGKCKRKVEKVKATPVAVRIVSYKNW